MPTDPFCRCLQNHGATFALVERMLDAAELAGVDLWELEQHRRRLERDTAEYNIVVNTFGGVAGRAQEVRQSIEFEVDVLAEAFMYLRAIVEGAESDARP